MIAQRMRIREVCVATLDGDELPSQALRCQDEVDLLDARVLPSPVLVRPEMVTALLLPTTDAGRRQFPRVSRLLDQIDQPIVIRDDFHVRRVQVHVADDQESPSSFRPKQRGHLVHHRRP